MSGGSYNYLDATVSLGLFGDAIDRTQLDEMVERLEVLPWAVAAASDARSIIERAKALDDELRKLGDVFHAIEWWDSADWSEDQARRDVEAYEPPAVDMITVPVAEVQPLEADYIVPETILTDQPALQAFQRMQIEKAFTEAARRFLTLLEVPTLHRLPDDPRYPGGIRFKITANARRLRSTA